MEEKNELRLASLRFFNTNNLWVDLEALADQFRKSGGALQLPVMKRGPQLAFAFIGVGVGGRFGSLA